MPENMNTLEGLAELLAELDTQPNGWEPDAAMEFDSKLDSIDTGADTRSHVTQREQWSIDRDTRPELTASGTQYTSNLPAIN